MNENLETMEVENIEDYEVVDTDECISGKVIGLTIALFAGAAALGVAVYKKFKAKSDDKHGKNSDVEDDDSDVCIEDSEEVDE